MSLQTTHTSQLSINQLSQDKIELLKRTICKGATNEELELFIHACNRTGLDPFMRQIYAIKRSQWDSQERVNKEVMTIQTGIDGYRLIAERTGTYMPGKETHFEYKDGKIFSAVAFAKKLGPDKQWHEISHKVYWEEYAAYKKDGSLTAMWQKGHIMLGKCAESGLLRKGWPADLSGVYTHEEMSQAHVETIAIDPVVKDVFTTEAIINPLQYSELLDMLDMDSDEDYLVKDLFPYLSRKSGQEVTSLQKVPVSLFETCKKAFSKRKEKRDAEKVSHVLDKPISDEIAF